MMPKNSICAEIGAFRGEFSVKILKHVKPKKLFLIDSWDAKGIDINKYGDAKKIYDKVTKNLGVHQSIKIIKSDSSKASKQFPDSFFDWVYINADHSYKGVKTDLEVYFRTVKPNGFITGDDYGSPRFPSVAEAVNNFINKYPVTLIKIKNYQFILKKEHSDE